MNMTLETIRAAHARIAPYIVQTPLLRLPALDDALGCEVYVKAECMQRTGAFKLRGAMNKILTLTDAERARGFVAAPDKDGYVWHSSQRMAVEVSKLSNGMPACVIRAVVPQAEQPAVSLVAMYGPMRQSPVSGLFYFEGKHGKVFFGPPYPSRGGDTQSFEIGIIPGI